MKILKALGIWLAAEAFCLFISLTLAGSSSTFIRIVCSFCTVGILAVLITDFAVREAVRDMKSKRLSEKNNAKLPDIATGAVLSLPSAVSWILLYISVSGGSFDFYRFHKLINAPFLQIYNLICPNASSAALKSSQVWIMLPLIFIPAAVYLTVYFFTYNRKIFTEKTENI